jgi:hypothetical protein
MGIIESDIRRVDIMPSSEAQREVSEFILGWRESITLRDEVGGDEERIRIKNNIQVFVSRSDGRYVGNKALFDGEPYLCELGGKTVSVTPIGLSEDNRRRKFAISNVEGVIVTRETIQDN